MSGSGNHGKRTDLRSYSRAVAKGESAEPDANGGGPSPSSLEVPQAPNDLRDVSFTVSMRGYDREAVDAYVARVDRVITELESTRSPEAAVKHALEQAGERISGILQRAGETAEEIATSARQKAEETTARAEEEAEAIGAKARAEAEATLARARADADESLRRAEEEVTALREEAEARMRELHADTEAIREQRRLLLGDVREIAARVEEAASAADARFPPPAPAESDVTAV